MHRQALIVTVCALLLATAQTASAQVGQAWTDRGYFNINGGFESASGTLADATTFREYDENGSLAVTANVDSGSFFDIAAGVRVWRNFSVGLAGHRGSTSGEAAVTASIPHPLFFNRHRQAAFGVSDLNRTEQALHLQFGYMIPDITNNLDVQLLVGPSFFRLEQEVVSDISFEERNFPFDTVTTDSEVTERTDSATGVNAGIDVTYRFVETGRMKFGAGIFLRYAGASGKVRVLNNTIDSDMGGFQFGIGGRVRF